MLNNENHSGYLDYGAAYNALKHSGSQGIKASADLTLDLDLKAEANTLISDAIDDFRKVPVTQYFVNHKLPLELLTLLQSPWDAP